MHRRFLPGFPIVGLVVLTMLLVAGCTGGLPATDTPTPIPTSTVAEQPTAAPTDTSEPATPTEAPSDTPEIEASPTEEATPSPAATIDPSALAWKQTALAGMPVLDLALHAGGTNVVLASGPDGAWRSSYDYTQWQAFSLDMQGARVSTAAIGSPEVMYVTGHTSCASGGPVVGHRTVDGGNTWQEIPDSPLNLAASDAQIAYGTTCMGVVKTSDSGAAWTQLPDSSVQNYDPFGVAASPDGATVFAVYTSEGGTGRIMRSTDGGNTWKDVTPKNDAGEPPQAPGNLIYDPGSEGRPDDGGLYMTDFQGLWFLPVEGDVSEWRFTAFEQNGPLTLPNYVTAMYVDTAYSEEYNKPGPVIYIAAAASSDGGPGSKVFRSTDLGATWQPFGTGIEGTPVNSLVLAPHDPAASAGMVETLLAATGDGIWAIPLPPPFR